MKPRAMRIAFVIDHFFSDLAGTEHQVVMMINGLARLADVELICLRDSEWLDAHAQQLPCRIKTFRIDNFRSPRTYRDMGRLVAHLRRTRPDVVHTFFPVANIVGILCARLAGISNTVASRRDYGEWMSARYLLATRVANWWVRRIVTNSDEVKRLTVRVEKFPADRIDVIYNGIAVDSFRRGAPNQQLRQQLGIAEDKKIVGLVANYRPMKRHQTLIHAAAEVARQRSDIDFLLVGDNAVPGDPKAAIQQLVVDLGLTQRVHFAHASGNVREFLSLFDVGVNCSEGEGLSNAIMEYMASEIPCVVSASGGNPDLITNDVHGRSFALDDHQALARGIIEMIDHPATRQRMVAEALVKVRRQMSFEAMVDSLYKFYQSLDSVPGAVPRPTS